MISQEEAEEEDSVPDVSGTIMEKDENPGEAPTGRVPETQSAEDEDVRDQTSVQPSQGDICTDQEMQPSSPSQRLGQNRVCADGVGNSTATGEIILQLKSSQNPCIMKKSKIIILHYQNC